MIQIIETEYDEDRLRQEAMDREGYEPFVDPKNGNVIEKWLIKRRMSDYSKELVCKFQDMLKCDIKPRFYIQEKDFMLPWHVDRGTKCAVNIVLSTQGDPIEFRHTVGEDTYRRKYYYRCALIDTTQEHRVKAISEPRVLFKMSIFDKSFEEAREAYDTTY